MSASHLIETWEHGRAEDPPTSVTPLLNKDERLLWVARLESAALTLRHANIGAFFIFMLAVLMLFGPRGESQSEYCELRGNTCSVYYYLVWPSAFVSATYFLVYLQLAWKSKYRPTVLVYAITTKRAFVCDESRPEGARFVELDKHPAAVGHAGITFFRGRNAFRFDGLDAKASARARYWATTGRLSVQAEKESTT